MKKVILVFVFALTSSLPFAQGTAKDTTATAESVKGTWDLNLDLASRYV